MSGYIIRCCPSVSCQSGSSYAINRTRPIGEALGGRFRFEKTSIQNAAKFRTEESAKKVLRSIKRVQKQDGVRYSVVKL